ncbi:predicted protein [Plenodomus lingam JN3]|uniref:Predicted protein n=1 Tax=Leptosphaeria maculans (strain JN3 / isolate v23.1.3 / race Av1-4-5-6-7-8) TaxID=985895 RepID=E5ACA2_LEPMJ|nr:predicted protein [Plenodomus lingam JN3]CBY02104.1 predicted protein [Plenodomus lingam JN3]
MVASHPLMTPMSNVIAKLHPANIAAVSFSMELPAENLPKVPPSVGLTPESAPRVVMSHEVLVFHPVSLDEALHGPESKRKRSTRNALLQESRSKSGYSFSSV